MRYVFNILISLFIFTNLTVFAQARATTTESAFKDVFLTAGYSAVLGAGIGAALLGLSEKPSGKLRYIAIGASIGFLSGTFLGTCFVIYPTVSSGSSSRLTLNSEYKDQQEGGKAKPYDLVLRPVLDGQSGKIKTLEADWLIARF